MYTLYWGPNSAALAPQILLEEIAAPHELKTIDTSQQQHQTADYLKLNPNGKIPTLVIDGKQALFESAAICLYLADRHPEAKLAPSIAEPARGLYYQWLAHLTNTLQPAYLAYYYPDRLTDDPKGAPLVQSRARKDLAQIWGRIDKALGEKGPYLLGDRYSACDAFLFMLSCWQEPLPDLYGRFKNVKRCAELVRARPAVQRILPANGLAA
ncbi:MAG TPA: glutathione S-transferase family protein [Hypericibacter adhaerens]|jgi:glutathione S-transferase|uniref:Glutathione S-transferase n=1 Tax=Hypericibacter adhaerens TaxID=2602016 RepID=A0A5J6N6Q0_9PROT|nr:glutathione S-transferase family protein [Hypericibacter adhaerens]QEX25264.1 glutathione S-transferase [Hypericibacter adhaerens]HWA44302.1 glutathione S-transferase family protein [Hypericibacter adhaerens]